MSLVNKIISDLEERQALISRKEGKVFQNLSVADNLQPHHNMLPVRLFTLLLFFLASVSATYALMGNRVENALSEIVTDAGPHGRVTPDVLTEDRDGNAVDITVSDMGLDMPVAPVMEKSHSVFKLDVSLSSMEAKAAVKNKIAQAGVPVNIRTVNLYENDTELFLNLALASSVDYRVYSLSDPDRIVLEIDDAVFDGELPGLDGSRSIKGFEFRKDKPGKVALVMNTTKAFNVSKTELEPAASGFILSMSASSYSEPDIEQSASIVPDRNPDLMLALTPAPISAPETTRVATTTRYGEMDKSIRTGADEARSRKIYVDARELYQHGRHQRANEMLAGLLKISPGYGKARTLLVQKLIEQGQLAKSEQILKVGLVTQPENSVWADLYARLLVNRGDMDSAIKVLASMKPDTYSEPDYYAFLAALYQKVKRHQKAVYIYRQVLQVRPDNGVWWMGLAISLESLKQHNDALFAYQKALQGSKMSLDLKNYVHGKIDYLSKSG